MRAPKVCSEPRCPNTQPCPTHQRKPWAGSTRHTELPKGWARIRKRILNRDPICTMCQLALATEVHHVDGKHDHSEGNLAGVCKACHKTETQQQAARGRA